MIRLRQLKKFSRYVWRLTSLKGVFYMFYVPEEYSNYKYLADYGSNYVVLSSSRGIYGSSR